MQAVVFICVLIAGFQSSCVADPTDTGLRFNQNGVSSTWMHEPQRSINIARGSVRFIQNMVSQLQQNIIIENTNPRLDGDVALTIVSVQADTTGNPAANPVLYVTIGALLPPPNPEICSLDIGNAQTISDMLAWAVDHALVRQGNNYIYTGGVFYPRRYPRFWVAFHSSRPNNPMTWQGLSYTFPGPSAAGVDVGMPQLLAGARVVNQPGGGRRLLQAACEAPAGRHQSSGSMGMLLPLTTTGLSEDECKNPPGLLARFQSLFHIGIDNLNPFANLFKVVALATPCVQFHGTKVGRRDAVVIGPGNRTIIFPDGSQWVLGTTVNTTYAIAPSGIALYDPTGQPMVNATNSDCQQAVTTFSTTAKGNANCHAGAIPLKASGNAMSCYSYQNSGTCTLQVCVAPPMPTSNPTVGCDDVITAAHDILQDAGKGSVGGYKNLTSVQGGVRLGTACGDCVPTDATPQTSPSPSGCPAYNYSCLLKQCCSGFVCTQTTVHGQEGKFCVYPPPPPPCKGSDHNGAPLQCNSNEECCKKKCNGLVPGKIFGACEV